MKKLRSCDYCGKPIGFEYRIDHWAPINPDETSHECEQYRRSSTKKMICDIARKLPEIEKMLRKHDLLLTRLTRSAAKEKDHN